MGRSCSQNEDWSAFKILTGKIPLGMPRGSLEDNIRMDLKEIGIITSNLVYSVQVRDY